MKLNFPILSPILGICLPSIMKSLCIEPTHSRHTQDERKALSNFVNSAFLHACDMEHEQQMQARCTARKQLTPIKHKCEFRERLDVIYELSVALKDA